MAPLAPFDRPRAFQNLVAPVVRDDHDAVVVADHQIARLHRDRADDDRHLHRLDLDAVLAGAHEAAARDERIAQLEARSDVTAHAVDDRAGDPRSRLIDGREDAAPDGAIRAAGVLDADDWLAGAGRRRCSRRPSRARRPRGGSGSCTPGPRTGMPFHSGARPRGPGRAGRSASSASETAAVEADARFVRAGQRVVQQPVDQRLVRDADRRPLRRGSGWSASCRAAR